ncbi:MAG: mechanosensitive ion channel [Rubritalea sp.]|jgi:small conductance mechanosensitive channel
MLDFNEILNLVGTYATTYGIKLVVAIVVFIIGLKVIGFLCKGMSKWFDRADYDEALEGFLLSLTSMALRVILVVTCAGILGIPTTSFVAILGAAGLAVGLALSGTLQNFAGGVLLLILKPFKIGDFIEAEGHTGKVMAIQIFNTTLNTPDNKRIILPNGPIATGAIINYSAEKKRRVDFVFGIGYDDDIDKARSIIRGLIDADSRIDQDPEPVIVLSELGDSSVNLTVRVWSDAADLWDIKFNLNEQVKHAFDAEGISFPFPQTNVHIHKGPTS